ncbi:cilia- and flagella-associated protein 73 [Seriola dumerili]|uniref:Cilia and flagella associated protein 73 n=1 Tax=Seriola dumerili TaxID=41447 RepID=A0A3B4UK05_SERDU|nr:cilia- and flagella-associated protein 73 [Seriola dumerili]
MSLSKPIHKLSPDLFERSGSVESKFNKTTLLFDLQKRRREDEGLTAALEEREQKLESLHQCRDELHKVHQKVQELKSSFDTFLKNEDADRAVEKAEKEREEVLQKTKEIERLKKEKAELIEGSQQLKLDVQSHTIYQDILEQMVKLTKFKDVDLLTDYVESLLRLKDQLSVRERAVQEQVYNMKKELVALNDQHHLLQLQKNNELSQLQTELDDTRSETLLWERKWTQIQETAAKKTLQLGQIKIAILNLFEMTGGTSSEEEEEEEEGEGEGEDGVDLNDAEKQLDKIMVFIHDYANVVKQHQTPLQHQTLSTLTDVQKSDSDNVRVTTRSKHVSV